MQCKVCFDILSCLGVNHNYNGQREQPLGIKLSNDQCQKLFVYNGMQINLNQSSTCWLYIYVYVCVCSVFHWQATIMGPVSYVLYFTFFTVTALISLAVPEVVDVVIHETM